MVRDKAGGNPSAVQAADKAGQGHRGRTSRSGRSAKDAREHSSAGGTASEAGMTARYVIVIEKADGNYGAYAPDLPGCVALGDTVQETVANMRKSIEMHLEGMAEDGDQIPEATSTVDYIEIEAPEAVKGKTR